MTQLVKPRPRYIFADVFMRYIFRSDEGAYRIPELISSTSSDRKINTSAKIYLGRGFTNCVILSMILG